MASKFKFWLAIILAVGFLFFCDAYLGEYSLGIVNNIAIFITLAISYNLINGVNKLRPKTSKITPNNKPT